MSPTPKILLVDDREDNLYVLKWMLAEQEVELLEARSGREALELLGLHEVALALVDVQMPAMDGFELAEAMRGSERTREIPLIFVTAGVSDQARVFAGYELGAVDFLVKPLEPHVLNGKVAVFLQLYRQRRQLAERVAELEAAHEALGAAERRYRELVRDAPAAIYEVDFRNRRFVSANDATARMLGYSWQELAELDPIDILEEEDRARFEQRLQSWLDGRAPEPQTEYRVRARDGRVLDVVLTATFTRAADGSPLGATVVASDVTERKRAERALAESEARYRAVFESAKDAILVTDPEPGGRVLSANPAARTLFGYDEDEIGRLRKAALLAPGQAPSGEGGPAAAELTYVRKDGSRFPGELTSSSYLDVEGERRAVSVVRDVSERKRAEQELFEAQERLLRQEKLTLVGSLAGAVAHELRNPLGSIKNAAYFLAMEPPPDDRSVTEAVQLLTAEVERAERIISSLLDFAWPKPPETRPVQARDLLRDAVERSGVPSEVALEQDVEEGLEVLGDPDQLLQVLGALIVNAVQAMPGGGRLSLRAHRANGETVFEIEDSGPGIEDSDLGRLFEPLFTTKARGLGLGLAIAKELLTRNKGSVEVVSEKGEGARFTLRLPSSL